MTDNENAFTVSCSNGNKEAENIEGKKGVITTTIIDTGNAFHVNVNIDGEFSQRLAMIGLAEAVCDVAIDTLKIPPHLALMGIAEQIRRKAYEAETADGKTNDSTASE